MFAPEPRISITEDTLDMMIEVRETNGGFRKGLKTGDTNEDAEY